MGKIQKLLDNLLSAYCLIDSRFHKMKKTLKIDHILKYACKTEKQTFSRKTAFSPFKSYFVLHMGKY